MSWLIEKPQIGVISRVQLINMYWHLFDFVFQMPRKVSLSIISLIYNLYDMVTDRFILCDTHTHSTVSITMVSVTTWTTIFELQAVEPDHVDDVITWYRKVNKFRMGKDKADGKLMWLYPRYYQDGHMGIPVLHPLSFLINSIQNIHGTIDNYPESYTVDRGNTLNR